MVSRWGSIIICAGMISSCASFSKSEKIDNYTVTVKTSPCFGRCPFYEMNVSTDGKASYEGFKYPKTDGIIKLSIDKSEIDSLDYILSENDFWGLDSLYDNPLVTDLPSISITLEGQNKVKTVVGRYNTPENFRKITAFIERLRKRNFVFPE